MTSPPTEPTPELGGLGVADGGTGEVGTDAACTVASEEPAGAMARSVGLGERMLLLDHLGYAVADLDAAAERLREAFDLSRSSEAATWLSARRTGPFRSGETTSQASSTQSPALAHRAQPHYLE